MHIHVYMPLAVRGLSTIIISEVLEGRCYKYLYRVHVYVRYSVQRSHDNDESDWTCSYSGALHHMSNPRLPACCRSVRIHCSSEGMLLPISAICGIFVYTALHRAT